MASASAFQQLLAPKTGLRGYDRRNCALWQRHAGACAGYHAERAAMGIPEPPRLDPLCGAAALAASLKAMGLPSDKKTVLSAVPMTGEGSSLQNIVDGAKKLGVVAHAVTADDQGLIALPKPLVAYVERDHFISVVDANKQGVSYLCSDCGPWPGGRVNLTWKQWHALTSHIYTAVVAKRSDWDKVLSQLHTSAPQMGIRLAMAGPLSRLHLQGIAQQARLLRRIEGHVFQVASFLFTATCGAKNEGQHCACHQRPPLDGNGSKQEASAGDQDPVNLATLEEQYTPRPDLTVYNPIGPSVSWKRIYNSLRNPTGNYLPYDYGVGWSNEYNLVVTATTASQGQARVGLPASSGGASSATLVFPNGSGFNLSASTTPSASNPHVTCSVPAGWPLKIQWNYDSGTGNNYYTFTFPDRSQWITSDAIAYTHGYNGGAGGTVYVVASITDRNGNAIHFNYGASVNGYPLLTSITDQNNSALLTIFRAMNGSGNITSIADRYSRSVYYNVSSYPTVHVWPGYPQSYQELDHVSQIVATGTPNPPDRYVYSYSDILNGVLGPGNQPEAVPFLSNIAVPSPTGTGTVTASINYSPNTCYVSSIVDANGNSRSYTIVDASHTKVTVADKHSNVVYSYTVGFDNNMDETTRTDGAGTIISSNVYSDPNDPYAPSTIQDGNGYAANPGGTSGKGTWHYTWDALATCKPSPRLVARRPPTPGTTPTLPWGN